MEVIGSLLSDPAFQAVAAGLLGALTSWAATRLKHRETMQGYVQSGFQQLYEQHRALSEDYRRRNDELDAEILREREKTARLSARIEALEGELKTALRKRDGDAA